MVKANELMVKNIVNYKGAPYSITGIDIHEIQTNQIMPGLFTPIPLTPDILEKCGFSKTSYEDQSWYEYQSENGIIFCEDDKKGYCEVVLDFYSHVRARYLHQLQNLYFALTGTELEVKL